MVAPVTVLHLTDPGETAVDRIGEQRARELMDDGGMTPITEMIEHVKSAPVPRGRRFARSGDPAVLGAASRGRYLQVSGSGARRP